MANKLELLVCRNRSETKKKELLFLEIRKCHLKFILFYQCNNGYVQATITSILRCNLQLLYAF